MKAEEIYKHNIYVHVYYRELLISSRWDSLENRFTFDVVFKTTFTAYIEDLLYNHKDTLKMRLPLSIKVLH